MQHPKSKEKDTNRSTPKTFQQFINISALNKETSLEYVKVQKYQVK